MMDDVITHPLLKLAALALLAALTACSHPTTSSSNAAPGGAAATPQSSPLVLTSSTYEATLKPGTRLIDATTMKRAYRGPTSNGTLMFDAGAAPEVATIAPGTVAVFAGVALLRVSGVTSSGGTASVAGTPVGLEDVIDNGHIAWTAPLDFGKLAFDPPPGFHRVVASEKPLLALMDLVVPSARAGLSLANNTWDGKVKDWAISIALTPTNGNLHLDLHATKTIGGGTIDVHGVGQFDGLTNQGSITLANGSTTEITFDNKKLHGTVKFDWKVAFDAAHGGSDPVMRESDIINLPFALELPFAVGPIPFKLTIKTGFAFQPAFTSKVTVAQGSYHADYHGGAPMTATAATPEPGAAADSAPAPQGDAVTTGTGTIDSYGGTLSVAAVGLSTTVALPKISLTLGLPGALGALLPTSDFGGPYATMMTQANFLATGATTIVQCERRELNLVVIVGYTPGLLGKLKLKPQSKTILSQHYSEIRPPNITLCKG